MLIRPAPEIRSSEITPERDYLNRREFMAAAGLIVGTGVLEASSPWGSRLAGMGRREDELTPYEDVTSYNNFYEFGTGKDDPAKTAGEFRTRPWTVKVEGEVGKPGLYDLDDLLGPHTALAA